MTMRSAGATLLRGLPDVAELEPFPDYPFHQCIEREVPLEVIAAAAVALDFTNQCMDCRYQVGSVVGQEIFERDANAQRFIVWQDVSKQILPKIHVSSSSFAEVRLFASPDSARFTIDTCSLARERAQRAAKAHGRRSAPAFEVLHSRWTMIEQTSATLIRLEAGGRTSGIANLIPKPILRFELRNVIAESLDFFDPER